MTRHLAIVLRLVDPVAGTVKCLVHLAALGPGVSAVTTEASVHASDLVLILAQSLELPTAEVTIFPPRTGPCVLFGLAPVYPVIESPVLAAIMITIPPL